MSSTAATRPSRPVPRRARWLAVAAVAVLGGVLSARPSPAQLFSYGLASRFELSEAVHVDEIDAATKAHLQRVAALSAAGQWDEVADALCGVLAGDPAKVVAVSPRRHVNVRDYCHLQLAALPDEALALYRGRVDAEAKTWLDRGLATRDEDALLRVVDDYFASSSGDDALLALGELALERGDTGGARGYWERLIESPPGAIPAADFERARDAAETSDLDRGLLARWYAPDSSAPPQDYLLRDDALLPAAERRGLVALWRARQLSSARLAYPRTDLDAAAIYARLVQTSIVEGSRERARAELANFTRLYPQASGRMGGLEVHYATALAELLEHSADWPRPSADDAWETFAGSPQREKIAAAAPDTSGFAWDKPQPLPRPPATESGFPSPRVAENKNDLLSYHPVVFGGHVLVNTAHEIRAYDLRTGRPAWGADPVIYRPSEPVREMTIGASGTLGVPRFTMTVHQDRVYARMGDPHTSRPDEGSPYAQGSYLVCLDLAAEGRLVWQSPRLEEKWAFEGSPICDGAQIYVALRRSEVRPQAHVACYDARTGRPRWRQFVCGAETPARGQAGECTHNLLTLAHGTLYVNTNLGAVAALSARDGRPKWITRYPRAKKGDLNDRAPHFYRDLTPCLYDRGRVIVAPADTESVLALDAPSGLVHWETGLPQDVVHLLGVAGETLWASGEKLWQINVASGKVHSVWPEGPAPRGFGRGVLAGSKVYWPTLTTIHVFDQASRRELPAIDLAARGAGGGNLIAAGRRLLIVGSDQLLALGPKAEDTATNPRPLPHPPAR